MKTYISVGVGDMICLDSLLSQEEKNNITEIYWACRFGKDIAPLIKNNKNYPNLTNQYFIDDNLGKKMMQIVDSNAVNFWHFRPDFKNSFDIGCSLLNIDSNINVIDTSAIFADPERKYTGSSFIERPKIFDFEYLLFHYPTSTRPRSDIASIDDNDWNFVKEYAKSNNLEIIVISDHEITPPIENYLLIVNPDINILFDIAANSSAYAGCDSFCAILSTKFLDKEKIFIKSHNPNISNEILFNNVQQKYFLPYSPVEISQFYKSYIGF